MIKNLLLNILFPKKCLNCAKPGNYLCPKCVKKIKLIKIQKCPVCQKPSIAGLTHPKCLSPLSLNGNYSIFYYQAPTKLIIKKIKYQYCFDLIPFLAKLAKPHLPTNLQKFDLLIPIPLAKNRQKSRGFNQAEILAKHFSQFLKIPLKTNILIKTKQTHPQADIKKASMRRKNIRGAFACQAPKRIKNKSIILFDDITTTYSTLSEAAKTLKRNGVKSVWGLIIAHGR